MLDIHTLLIGALFGAVIGSTATLATIEMIKSHSISRRLRAALDKRDD